MMWSAKCIYQQAIAHKWILDSFKTW